jgi:hypothetical protein
MFNKISGKTETFLRQRHSDDVIMLFVHMLIKTVDFDTDGII